MSRAIDLLKRVAPGTVPANMSSVEPVADVPSADEGDMTPPAVVQTSSAPVQTEESDVPQSEVPAPSPVEPVKVSVESDDTDIEFNKDNNIPANFHRLRTKLKAVTNEKKELLSKVQQLSEADKRLKEYETGVAVPTVITEKENRIRELEMYERLHNFKASPLYREKYGAPIQENRQKLVALAAEYNVPEEVIDHALNADTTTALNRVLSSAFNDDLAAVEAKGIIKDIRKIQAEAQEAEKEPARAIERLTEEHARIQSERLRSAREGIVNKSKEAWVEALDLAKADNKYPELVYREGDSNHNDTVVRPVITKAAEEYSRLVKTLAENGLTELPKDVGLALSRMTQLAYQAAVAAEERSRLASRVAELEGLLNKTHKINRPMLSNNTGSNRQDGTTQKPTAEQRAMALLNSVR